MFWVFATNYLPWIFPAYYGADYSYATEKAENFVNLMEKSPWLVDKVALWFSSAEWPGVTIFAFFTGFSLWFSILNSGVFKVGDYVVKRFNGVYVPYLVSAVVAFLVGAFLRDIEVESFDLAALVMGAAAFVPSAARYNPSMWFISMVFLCYTFFPIIPIIYSKLRFAGLAILALAGLGFFAYYGASYFMFEKGPLYPLMPFWIFLCFGVVACHLVYVYRHLNLRIKGLNLGVVDMLCLPAIILGMYFMYRYLYLEPASDLEAIWFARNSFPAAMAGALVFFAIGYLLPVKLHRLLRWLSRGTLGVFLYHYIFLPFLVPYIGPSLFTTHLAITLVVTYYLMLVYSSLLQILLDATIIKCTRFFSGRAYEIRARSGFPVLARQHSSEGTANQPR